MKKISIIVVVLIFFVIANSVYANTVLDKIGSDDLAALNYLGEWSIETFCIKAEGRCIGKESLSSTTLMKIYADNTIEFVNSNGDVDYLNWEIIDNVFFVKDPEFGNYTLVYDESDNIIEDNDDYKLTWYQENPLIIKYNQIFEIPSQKDYEGKWSLIGLGSGDVFRDAVFFKMEGSVQISGNGELSLMINNDSENNVPFELKEGKIESVFPDYIAENVDKIATFTLLSDGILLMSFETDGNSTLTLAFEREAPKPTELE